MLLTLASSLACAPPAPTEYDKLVDNLKAAGAAALPGGEISQPFFSVKGRFIKVNGEDVQVFEYASAGAADADAAKVSSDGSSVGTTMISWVADPHFYKSGRLIVLYVGTSRGVLDVLVKVLGPQFAGRIAVTANITAFNNSFDKTTITVPRGSSVLLLFNNQDTGVAHNVAIYEGSSATKLMFRGEVIIGANSTAYRFTVPSESGSYYFRCDIHPWMEGSFTVGTPES